MSVELQKLRSELFREALLKGWTRPEDVQEPWLQLLSRSRIDSWYKRLYKTSDTVEPVGRRLINHFMLGADPEFVFHDGTNRVDARTLSLKAGPAFGADNNGRLCELRPAPSRSALSVLTSIWLAMRWMTLFQPDTLRYNWRSGGYYGGDGLGGHVHFGRKRTKFRDREVAVLDRLAHLQFVAGLFDREEGRLRVRQAQGAPQGQPYGALGDIRLQPHGYEYRTLPSWIDNPWLAYFNLVVSKLVVALPDLAAPLSEADANIGAEAARLQLRLLLAYYSPLDDDARLALAILSRRGFPTHAAGLDFKSHWGLFAPGPFATKTQAEVPRVLPESLPSSPEDEMEMASSMFEGRQPECLALKPSWQPHTLPEGYYQAIWTTDTRLAPGLGELAMQLCFHSKCKVQLVNMGHSPYAFRFPAHLHDVVYRSGLLRQMDLPADCGTDGWELHVNASKDYSMEQLLKARKLIVDSGLFPIWDVREVKSNSYEVWDAPSAPKAPTGSKVAFNSTLNGAKEF